MGRNPLYMGKLPEGSSFLFEDSCGFGNQKGDPESRPGSFARLACLSVFTLTSLGWVEPWSDKAGHVRRLVTGKIQTFPQSLLSRHQRWMTKDCTGKSERRVVSHLPANISMQRLRQLHLLFICSRFSAGDNSTNECHPAPQAHTRVRRGPADAGTGPLGPESTFHRGFQGPLAVAFTLRALLSPAVPHSGTTIQGTRVENCRISPTGLFSWFVHSAF